MAATRVTVELHGAQLRLLDDVVAAGAHGSGREQTLRGVLREHVRQRRDGMHAYVGGTSRDDVVTVERPQPGPPIRTITLEPVTGAALTVRRGEVLRIEQVDGGTCVDFNAFNLDDHREQLSCGFTRGAQGFDPRTGELIWSNAPRGRPMFAILEMASSCDLDIAGHRCNRVFNELWWGDRAAEHPNCQDTLAEAIREYGLSPDDVHDSFNLWMSTTIDEHGRRRVRWNPAGPGDRVDVLALFDVVAAVCICGVGDLLGINNYTFTPIRVEVLERTDGTAALADRIEERWGRLETQVRTQPMAIRAERRLAPDPGYVPAFRPLPARTSLDVELDADEHRAAVTLLESGVYGDGLGAALRAAFMRWCNANHTLSRRPRIEFAGGPGEVTPAA